MSSLDLSTLSLRSHSRQPHDYEDDPELGRDEAGYLDDESARQNRVQTVLCYEIVEPGGRVVGRIDAWIYRTKEFQEDGDWLMFMDEESQETHEFSCLFSDHARLKPQFSREGTGVWGSEVTESPFLAYIKGIRVEPEYRGHGIGPWALQKLLDPTDPHFGTVDFIFAWPTPHPKDAPARDVPNREQEWDVQAVRAVKTFQRAGYRRVGTTAFFCVARDPKHPSRRIPIDQDAKYTENVTMNQEQLIRMLATGQLPW